MTCEEDTVLSVYHVLLVSCSHLGVGVSYEGIAAIVEDMQGFDMIETHLCHFLIDRGALNEPNLVRGEVEEVTAMLDLSAH